MRRFYMIILLLLLSSCATYHTRLFLLDNSNVELNATKYKIFPQIGAYKNSAGGGEDLTKVHDFDVLIHLKDTIIPFPDSLLDKGLNSSEYKNARELFHKRASNDFAVDTLIVAFLPNRKRITLSIVKEYLGWGWEVEYYFGKITIPFEVDSINVLVPYQSYDSTGSVIYSDTLIYKMHRFESHKRSLWVG